MLTELRPLLLNNEIKKKIITFCYRARSAHKMGSDVNMLPAISDVLATNYDNDKRIVLRDCDRYAGAIKYCVTPVSYTHLDVYKRQWWNNAVKDAIRE